MAELRIIDRGAGWVVEADWHGATRVVFRGSLRACLNFRRDTERLRFRES